MVSKSVTIQNTNVPISDTSVTIRDRCGLDRSQEGESAVFGAAERKQDEDEFKTTDFTTSGSCHDCCTAVCRCLCSSR